MDFLNNFDLHFPHTFAQFEKTLDGDLNVDRRGKPIPEVKSKRWLVGEFFKRVFLIPADIPVRFLINMSLLAETIVKTLALFRNFKKNKEALRIKAKKLADYTISVLLSPLQSPTKSARLFIGMLNSKSFYKDPSKVVLRRQLCYKAEKLATELSSKKYLNIFLTYSNKNCTAFEINKFARFNLLTAIFYYSRRWNLIYSTSPRFLNRKDQMVKFNHLHHDLLTKKMSLLHSFENLLDKWNNHPNKVTDQSLEKFLKRNFKSKTQKNILKDFFSKENHKIFGHSFWRLGYTRPWFYKIRQNNIDDIRKTFFPILDEFKIKFSN